MIDAEGRTRRRTPSQSRIGGAWAKIFVVAVIRIEQIACIGRNGGEIDRAVRCRFARCSRWIGGQKIVVAGFERFIHRTINCNLSAEGACCQSGEAQSGCEDRCFHNTTALFVAFAGLPHGSFKQASFRHNDDVA